VVAIVFAAAVVCTSASWPRQPRITRAAFALIQDEMSLAEVESILGAAPGDYTTQPTATPDSGRRIFLKDSDDAEREIPLREWKSDTAIVQIAFDESEKVVFKHYASNFSLGRQGPLENLLWRAKRQWRKWFP
jgi:hypothetical protein